MNPDFNKSIKFLEWLLPEGPWVLTSIKVDDIGIETRTFTDPQLVLEWLTMNQDRNCYVQVNPPTRPLSKKGSKTDVKEMRFLHLDLDPRAGEDIESERARIYKLLFEPRWAPKPNCVVFSGGGYQAYWRLTEPVPIVGDESAAEEAERYNKQLEIVSGADSCHNVDRIMRIPGTVNHPDKKKRDKGRTTQVALIEWMNDDCYPIEQFSKSAQSQQETRPALREPVETGNVRRLKDVHEVEDLAKGKVEDWLKVLIVQGNRADDDNPYISRSEALWNCVCELVRIQVTNDDIYSIITDPGFGISESVLDKGSQVERYALRQINRAQERAIDEDLMMLNDRYAHIHGVGGKARIAEVIDGLNGRNQIEFYSPRDFEINWGHRMKMVDSGRRDAQGTPIMKPVPLGKWWLQHPNHRMYVRVVFAPEKIVPDAYNLWRGFAVDAIPGDCSLFLEHIRNNLCSGRDDHYEYLLGWMARAVQLPHEPGRSAIVFRGKQGTGKSFFADQFGRLFGQHYLPVSDSKHLVGQFNGHLQDCALLFADEAIYAGNKKSQSTLKTLVTQDYIMIERKGLGAITSPNCLHILMASNENWVIPADADDRRFFVLDVSSDHACDNEYFRKIDEQMKNGGAQALLHMLRTTNMGEFEVRTVPKTEALREQKEMSLGEYEAWWLDKLMTGCLIPEHSGWRRLVTTHDLTYDLSTYLRSSNARNTNSASLGNFLSRMVPNLDKTRPHELRDIELPMLDGKTKIVPRPWAWVMPSLTTCRKHWDKHMYEVDWPDVSFEEDHVEQEESPF